MDLAKYILEILKPLKLPALFLIRPKEFPCISYHFFDEGSELNGDGMPVMLRGKLQIDLFAKKSSAIRGIRKQIIEAFKEPKDVIFTKITPDECNYEKEVSLYHQVIVFSYDYSAEGEVI